MEKVVSLLKPSKRNDKKHLLIANSSQLDVTC